LPRQEGHLLLNAPLSAVPLRSKKRKKRKEFLQCNNSANNLLLNSARSSPHRALWPRLRRQDNSGEFLARYVNREVGDLSDEDRKENVQPAGQCPVTNYMSDRMFAADSCLRDAPLRRVVC
jgi:hypothetical protein